MPRPPDTDERRPRAESGAPDDLNVTVAAGGSGGPGAEINDWTIVVRRARLGPTVKLVALVIASYADPDGTKVFPGIARLAVQCEIDYRTARRAVASLRERGLIELVRRGARRNGKSDEYRLVLTEDLLERCDVPTPAAERVAIERVTQRNRSTGHPRPVQSQSSGTDHRSPVPRANGSTGQTAHVLQVTPTPPPSIDLCRETQPPADDGQVSIPRTGSGTERAPVHEVNGKAAGGNPRTRDGTEQLRQAEADKLTEWMRLHPELA